MKFKLKPEEYHMSEKDIAAELGVSRNRVSQIVTEALEKIRQHPELSELLRPYLDNPEGEIKCQR